MNRVFAGPGRYVQGGGVIADVGRHVADRGTTALLVADPAVVDTVADPVTESFSSVSATYRFERFGGECTTAEVERLRDAGAETGCDVVVGIGGGKALDTGKAVGAALEAAFVSVPTIASTDAPISSFSVVYDDDGGFSGVTYHNRHPALVLVDTEVVVSAPTRHFVSGIGDAFATAVEADAVVAGHGQNVFEATPTYTARAIARACRDVLEEHAVSAVRAVEANAVTESVEATVETIILASGLGFENAGLAAAHGVHDGIASVEGLDGTHGEKVAVGVLAQLTLEGRPTEFASARSFFERVGLPVALAELDGVEPDADVYAAVGAAACHDESPIHNLPFEVSPAMVADALRAMDAEADPGLQ